MQPDEVVDAVERLGVLLDHWVEDSGLDERGDGHICLGAVPADRCAGEPADPSKGEPGDVVQEASTGWGEWSLRESEPRSEPAVLVGELTTAGILLGEPVRGIGEGHVVALREALAHDPQEERVSAGQLDEVVGRRRLLLQALRPEVGSQQLERVPGRE